jgi:hypothetical protein
MSTERVVWLVVMLSIVGAVGGAVVAHTVRTASPEEPVVMFVTETPIPTEALIPTQTAVPTEVPTVEPTARAVGANHVVREGENYWVITKKVCRALDYPMWDTDPDTSAIVAMNQKHNFQYVNSTLQEGEVVGIGCVLP